MTCVLDNTRMEKRSHGALRFAGEKVLNWNLLGFKRLYGNASFNKSKAVLIGEIHDTRNMENVPAFANLGLPTTEGTKADTARVLKTAKPGDIILLETHPAGIEYPPGSPDYDYLLDLYPTLPRGIILSGWNNPQIFTEANEKSFNRAVLHVAKDARDLLSSLTTNAHSHNRQEEAQKAHERAVKRFG